MRPWVDPGNNLVFADVHGTIGYRTRGRLPIRAQTNAWLPVPGWDGAHEWTGTIPFEAMPALRNPAAGWIVTANSRIVDDDYPHYLGLDYAPDFRTRRLAGRIQDLHDATVADMAALHADRASIPARSLVELAGRIDPLDAGSRAAARDAAELGRRHGRRQPGGDRLRDVPGAPRPGRPRPDPRPPGGRGLRGGAERRRRSRGAAPRAPGRVDPRRRPDAPGDRGRLGKRHGPCPRPGGRDAPRDARPGPRGVDLGPAPRRPSPPPAVGRRSPRRRRYSTRPLPPWAGTATPCRRRTSSRLPGSS